MIIFFTAHPLEMPSGGLHGLGGSMYLRAGEATGVGSVGGSIEIAAGGGASKGGDVSVSSGSGNDASGTIVIASNAGHSASGDVLISSGSSGGMKESGASGYNVSLYDSFLRFNVAEPIRYCSSNSYSLQLSFPLEKLPSRRLALSGWKADRQSKAKAATLTFLVGRAPNPKWEAVSYLVSFISQSNHYIFVNAKHESIVT